MEKSFTLEQYQEQCKRIEEDDRYPESLKAWGIEKLSERYEEVNGVRPDGDVAMEVK